MTREVRLGLIERRRAMFHAHPTPRVRVHVTPYSPSVDRAGDQYDADNLRSARGLLTATLLSVAFWMVVGFFAWLIAR